jgi:CHAT domain-containing protein
MQRVFFFLLFILSVHIVMAQAGSYKKAVEAYDAQKKDSAWIYMQQAIDYFRITGQTDSLVVAYTQKAHMAWYEVSVSRGLATIDSALFYLPQLPFESIAAVAALNKKGQILVNNSAALEGKKYFNDALKRIPSNAPPNDTYAKLYNNIAWMHLNLQELDEGIVFGEKSRSMIEAMYGKDEQMLTSVFQTLMYLAHDAGKLDEAEKYALEMQRLVNKHLPPLHTSRALAHNDLGTLYETMYRTDEALHHRQQMVAITQDAFRKNGNPHLLSIGFNNMGKLYEAIGEWQLANEYYEKALRLHTMNYGPDGVGLVRPLAHLANLKRMIKDFEAADSLFQRALRIQLQKEPNDKLNLAYVETLYGDLLFDRQQYAEAAKYYQRTLPNQKSSVLTAEATRTTLGEAYTKLNRFDEGFALIQQSLRQYRKIYQPGHIVIAGQLNKISVAWLDKGEPEMAMCYSDSVFLELLQLKQLPEGNWMDQLPYNHFIIQYIQNRANIESALFRKNNNSSHLRRIQQLAGNYSSYLEKILPAIRTQASLIQLASKHKYIYDAAVEACWQMHVQDKNPQWLEKAFAFSETSKSLLLRLASNNVLIDAAANVQDAATREDLHWRKRISQLNTQYLDEGGKNDSLLTLLSAAMESYYRFQEKLLKSNSAAASLKYRMKAATIDEIRNELLKNGETMLHYTVTNDAVFLFIINKKHFRVHRMPRNVLHDVALIRELYNLSPEDFARPAYRLYSQLVAPAKKVLLGNKLFIVPDDELHYLNFEVLISSGKINGFESMPYLVKQYEISTLLSATSALHYNYAQRQQTEKALLITPVFSDEMKAAYRKRVADDMLADNQYLMLIRQPFTFKAAKQISRFIKTDLLSEHDALESSFKQRASDYRILHLGTHAEINNVSPILSRFFLAKPTAEDSTSNDDGYLHAYEIYGMNLNANLAVLNACETGTGQWREGEGVISLAHSFMYAGCPSVVMTLWKVDEKTSAEVVTLFYKYLSRGMTKGAALQKAKIEYLRKAPSNLAHPYFWAGMTLVGDSQAVVTTKNNLWVMAGMGFGIMLVGGLALRFLLRQTTK